MNKSAEMTPESVAEEIAIRNGLYTEDIDECDVDKLVSDIAAAITAERKEKESSDQKLKDGARLVLQAADVLGEVCTLRRRLAEAEKYIQHRPSCAYVMSRHVGTFKLDCTCGLSTFRQSLTEKENG